MIKCGNIIIKNGYSFKIEELKKFEIKTGAKMVIFTSEKSKSKLLFK
jgi:hypothetical protein